MNNIIISEFKKQDSKEISHIILTHIENIYIKYYSSRLIKDFLENTTEKNIFNRSEDKQYYVARIADEIVGIVGLKGNELKTFHVKYIGKGIGRILLNYVESISRKNKKEELYVSSLPHALDVYKKLGFRQIKQDYNYSDLNKVKYKIYFMKKILKDGKNSQNS